MGVQEQASACSLRGLVPRPSGTAVYNAPAAIAALAPAKPDRMDGVKPVRTVVWEDGGGNPASYPIIYMSSIHPESAVAAGSGDPLVHLGPEPPDTTSR